MSRLTWQQAGKNRFENGVDRGVLYLPQSPGVVWNGITSVNESTAGGEREEYYFDGVKYLDFVAATEYQATLKAFSAPAEFSDCLGNTEVVYGFFLTGQPKSLFNLSYRTRVNGDAGYKIHLVYNAIASLSNKGYSSRSDSPSPTNLEMTITAKPPPSSTIRPVAHLFVDSTKASPSTLATLEDMLYGTDTDVPYFPEQSALIDLFNS